MSLHRDIYQEIGKWLDGRTMKTMRRTCKMIRDMYTLEAIDDRLKEERIEQSRDIKGDLKCLKCDEKLSCGKNVSEACGQKLYILPFPDKIGIGIYYYRGNTHRLLHYCKKCRRIYLLCENCDIKYEKRNLCQFIGHSGYQEKGNCIMKFSRDEEISETMKKMLGEETKELYTGLPEDDKYDWSVIQDLNIRVKYNIMDDYIFYFDLNGWILPNINDAKCGNKAYHMWKCLQCKNEFRV